MPQPVYLHVRQVRRRQDSGKCLPWVVKRLRWISARKYPGTTNDTRVVLQQFNRLGIEHHVARLAVLGLG